MATNEALAQGLRAVHRVVASEEFVALAADNDALKECFDDPEGALRRRVIHVCDAWPIDAADEPDEAGQAAAQG